MASIMAIVSWDSLTSSLAVTAAAAAASTAAAASFFCCSLGGEEWRASDNVRAALAAAAAACRRPRQDRWTPPELGEPGAGSRHFSFVSSNIPIADRSVVAAATGAERLWRGVVQSVTW